MNKIIIIIITLSFHTIFSQALNRNEINSLSREKAQDVFKEYREFLSLPNDANKPDELEPNMIWCENAFKKRGFTIERIKTLLPRNSLEMIAKRQPSPARRNMAITVPFSDFP